MANIEHELHKEKQAAKVLLANYNDLISDDEEMTSHLIEGETDLLEVIDQVVEEIAWEEVHIEALNKMIEKVKNRRDRKKAKVERLKTSIAHAVDMAGLKKYQSPLALVSTKKVAPMPVITDEALIPSDYFKSQDPKLDKLALAKDLKDKKEIPGAKLSNGGRTIQLRWS